jgi:hypothetical protein
VSQQPRRLGKRLGWRLRAADDAGGTEASLYLGCSYVSCDKEYRRHAPLTHREPAAVFGGGTGMRLTQAPSAVQ